MNIYEHIDYTLLKADATKKDIFTLCDEAIAKGCASVCIPSDFVYEVKEMYGDSLTICTVVGFPLGNSTIATKTVEAEEAIADGAKEIDMVMNIGEFKGGNHYYLKEEINAIANVMPKNAILKVIIETCYLTDEEIAIATRIVDESLADYVKTSTGFGTRGASFEDILVIKKNIHNGTKIKASGGIRTAEDMQKYIALGCDRIGASQLP
jgi:deoxyribose-phosphate aldolase